MTFNWQRILLFFALILGLNAAFLFFYPPNQPEPVVSIPYSLFKQELKNDQVKAVLLQGENLSGQFAAEQELTDAQAIDPQFKGKQKFTRFKTILPPVTDAELMPLLDKFKVRVRAEPVQGTSLGSRILIGVLPWVLIIGVWWYIIRKAQQKGGIGGGLLQRFSKSGAQLYAREQSRVTFEDVAGLAEAKQELQEIISFLRNPEKFSRLGGRVPRGVLLTGPPGTGKTLMARAVAGEAEVPFYSISASQFIEMFVGVGASRVRDLFTNAKKNAPSIIFVDELDAVGRARGTGLGGGNDEREQTLNQLLSELDGFEDHSQVIVLAATNRPDVLDAALLRPGRFDRQVVIERPDWRDRVKILQVHTRKMPLADDVDLELIAKGTPGMVGADLQSLVNEAALIAAREDVQQVAMVYFDRAKDRQLMGMERKLFLSEEEKYMTAIHEAGHALVAKAIPGSDPVHKITIIPRGQALGLTQQLPEDDRYHYQRSYLMGRLSVMLAGRAAEKQCFGEYSTGAQNDLKQVMSLAEKMVCQWGMSDRLGPLSYPRGEEHPFLGRKMASEKNFSEKTAWIIDQEIEQLVNTADRCAHAVVAGNREVLDALATLLTEEESLDRAAFDRFLDEHPLVLPKQECCDVSFRNPPEATEEPAPHGS
ncbi:ATP-dependent zinc metalloprotease FtsH [Pelobacter seleniigenes]|uniref:ATP-dependent zinc metalloprotease FtsH n=1 Tax=Pelobacter seleniigenes TaxID=407188 RepID=UPI0007AF45B1|nr:ATP-dependent zinc metalloprotease FtsH [Pelobacter seleniigenes]